VNPEPDERPQPDGAAPDEFDAIVSAWRREGHVPEWPDDSDGTDRVESTDGTDGTESPDRSSGLFEPAPAPRPDPPAPAAPPTQSAPDPAPAEDEHFVPPEPPPLPRLGPPAFVGLGLIALGLVLLVAPGWIVADPYGLPLGLVSLASGLGWLVLRLWPDPPSRDGGDDDDGAVI
jgi:hypothetical protein